MELAKAFIVAFPLRFKLDGRSVARLSSSWSLPCQPPARDATFGFVKTILQADETGALTLPSSVLPHPKAHQRYRVVFEGTGVIVQEATSELRAISPAERQEWIKELARRRTRGATGVSAPASAVIIDEIRAEPGE